MRKATHEERIKLAGDICKEVQDELQDDLRAFVIYASVAKNADGPYSDLETMAITAEGYVELGCDFIRDGIRCEVEFFPLSRVIYCAGRIDEEWPFKADQWHRILPIYVKDGDKCLEELDDACRKSLERDEPFKENAAVWMIETYELMGTLRNAWQKGIISDILTDLFFFSAKTIHIVAFVNHYFYQGFRNAWEESKTLPNLPSDFVHLIEIVHGEVATTIEARYNAALKLWDNIRTWAAEQDINWEEQRLEMPEKKET
ncbi:hypothetical protein GF338_07685 [candidate division WOR-3 bacterium]|nr:hypothetical protein [candidate division WOR-3 bacterium]